MHLKSTKCSIYIFFFFHLNIREWATNTCRCNYVKMRREKKIKSSTAKYKNALQAWGKCACRTADLMQRKEAFQKVLL